MEDVKELKESQVLSQEAKNILSDLDLSTDDSGVLSRTLLIRGFIHFFSRQP